MRAKVSQRRRTFARGMRKEPTEAEARLWYHLRAGRFDGVKFRRQVPIAAFIVDFVSFERMLAIELDGGQHTESASDAVRDAELRQRGFRVLRFWNHDVLADTDAVLTAIRDTLLP